MGHKVLIDGTSYKEISCGKVNVGGTTYNNIEKGKVRIDETVRELKFEVEHQVYLNPCGVYPAGASVKIGDTTYVVDQPITLLVPDKTPIECTVKKVYAISDGTGGTGGGYANIYINGNLFDALTPKDQDEVITYTHIADSKTTIFLGGFQSGSEGRGYLHLADDGNILFQFIGPNTEPSITVDGITWEERIGSGASGALTIVDGQVYLRMGVVERPLGYPDGTVVNSKDRILPLQYSAIW